MPSLPALIRVLVLALLFAAPLALGSVHEPAFVPLLALGSLAGILSWARGHVRRAHGEEVPAVPGRALLLALHAVVVAQLVPLPPALLRLVSPGSFAFYDAVSLLPPSEWRPISVNPADTARGLCFLAGMSLLFAAVFREFAEDRWQRRLAAAVAVTGFVMTLAALVQAASAEPTRIYGVWKPRWDWGVFGPYVSRNHFAGYLAMALPVALGFTAEAGRALSHGWRHRLRPWLALGDRAGIAFLQRVAACAVLVVGLLASRSRGGLGAATVGGLALLAALPGWRRKGLLVMAAAASFALLFADLSGLQKAFATRSLRQSRLNLWADAVRMFPEFPVLGAGFNAFGTSYTAHQHIERYEWYGEAHNEYLQALLDTGLVGAALVAALLALLLRGGWRAAGTSTVSAGLFAATLACCAHNLVDFNWQIPANAATFAVLAGLVLRRSPSAAPAVLDPPADTA